MWIETRTKESSEANDEDKMKIRTLMIFFVIERLNGQRRVDYQCRLDGGITGGFVARYSRFWAGRRAQGSRRPSSAGNTGGPEVQDRPEAVLSW